MKTIVGRDVDPPLTDRTGRISLEEYVLSPGCDIRIGCRRFFHLTETGEFRDVARTVYRAIEDFHGRAQCPTDAAPRLADLIESREPLEREWRDQLLGGLPVASVSAIRLPHTGVALKPQVPQPESMK